MLLCFIDLKYLWEYFYRKVEMDYLKSDDGCDFVSLYVIYIFIIILFV